MKINNQIHNIFVAWSGVSPAWCRIVCYGKELNHIHSPFVTGESGLVTNSLLSSWDAYIQRIQNQDTRAPDGENRLKLDKTADSYSRHGSGVVSPGLVRQNKAEFGNVRLGKDFQLNFWRTL